MLYVARKCDAAARRHAIGGVQYFTVITCPVLDARNNEYIAADASMSGVVVVVRALVVVWLPTEGVSRTRRARYTAHN